MADMRKDERFEEFLQSIGMSVAAFEALDKDAQTSLSNDMETWKKNNPLEGAESEPKYSIEDAIRISDKKAALDQLMPGELAALNASVKDAAKIDDEAAKAYQNIQKAIEKRVTYYAENRIMVDIDDADAMLALINSYEDGNENRAAEETKSDLIELLEKNGLTLEDYEKADDKTKDWLRGEMRSQYDAEIVAYLELNGISIDEYTSANQAHKDWIKEQIKVQKDADLVEFLEANNFTIEDYNSSDKSTRDWVDKEMKTQYEADLKDYLAKNNISEAEYNKDKGLQILAAQEMQKEKQLSVFLAKNGLTLEDYNSSDSKTRAWVDQEMQKDREEKASKFRDIVKDDRVVLEYRGDEQDLSVKGRAKTRLNNFVREYDEANGLTGLTPENSAFLDENSTLLEDIGVANLLSVTPFVEEPVQPMEFEKAKEIVANKTFDKLDIKEFASLQAAMDKYSGSFKKEEKFIVTKAARDNVLKVANGKKELDKAEMASFAFVLDNVAKYAAGNDKFIASGKLKKATKTLGDLRTEIKNTKYASHSDMQEAYDVLAAVNVTGKLTPLGRESFSQRDEKGEFLPDSEMGLFIASVKDRTKQQMLTSKETITAESFKANFSDNLQIALYELYHAQEILKENVTKEKANAAYKKFVALSQNGKKIDINQDSFIGYAAAKNKESNSFLLRLEKKVGNRKAVQTARKNHEAIDKNNTKKYGKKYANAKAFLKNMGKAGLKIGAWSAAFGVASSFGAPAVAAVAVVSLGNQVIGLRKDFKRQKLEASKQGVRLSFKQYMKKNPERGVGFALGAIGAAIPGLQMFSNVGQVGALANAIAPYMTEYRIGSALTGVAANIVKPIKQARKDKQSWWKVATIAGTSALGFFGGRAVANQFVATPDVTQPTYDVDAVTGETIPAPANGPEQMDQTNYVELNNIQGAENNSFQYFNENSPFARFFDGGQSTIVDNGGPAWDIDNNSVPDSIQLPADQVEQVQDVEVREAPQPERPAVRTEPRPTIVTENTTSTAATTNTEPVVEDIVRHESVLKGIEPLDIKPLEVNQDAAFARAEFEMHEHLRNEQVHTMVDSLGQEINYTVGSDGSFNIVGGDEGLTGHSDMGGDISKEVLARVENGTATEADLKMLAKYNSDAELVAEARETYTGNKETALAGLEEKHAAVRVEKDAALLAENETGEKSEPVVDKAEQTVEKPVEHAPAAPQINNPTQLVTNNGTVIDSSVEGVIKLSNGEGWSATITNDGNGNLSLKASGVLDIPPELEKHATSMTFKDGVYKVGSSESLNPGVAKSTAMGDMQRMLVSNEIISQYETRVAAGEHLDAVEQKHYNSLNSRLESWGYQRANDGHLQLAGADKSIEWSSSDSRAAPAPTVAENVVETAPRAEVETSAAHDAKPHETVVAETRTEPAAVNEVRTVGEGKGSFAYKIDETGRATFTDNNPPKVDIPKDVSQEFTKAVKDPETGRWTAGGVEHSNRSVAERMAKFELEQTYRNHEVYKNLVMQDNLNEADNKFMDSHVKDLSDRNLKLDAKGDLISSKTQSHNNQNGHTYAQVRDNIREGVITNSQSAQAGLQEAHSLVSILGQYVNIK
ncbi:MAG: hypothetical protein LBR70_04195 [Lactobacillaceae bacterium]|jgi:hypothetical protein|nr:hypothetical protein [Lactobacillaceae bacterium]